MPDDFTQRLFQYGLNDLPLEPPDDPNILFSPNGFTSIRMQRAAGTQVIPVQFRSLGRQVAPPGFYSGQGRGLAPGGGPVTEIPMPELWKTWGPVLGAIAKTLPSLMTGSGSGADSDTPECEQQWAGARDFCAKELAKPFPNKGLTGGYKNVEDCAKGYVAQHCGGNKKEDGYPSGDGNSKKGGDLTKGGDPKKAGSSPKRKPRRRGPFDVDPDDVPLVPE
jgi:hypothetical protein